jgi:hypothetical protein
MNSKLRATLFSASVVLVCMAGLVPGCAQPDNPTPTTAPTPAAPTPAEVAPHKTAGGKSEYGTGSRYKKMEENFAKQSGSPPPN